MNNRPNITIDEQQLAQIVDIFYAKMLDDYRINRYFYPRPFVEQTTPLKHLLNALFGGEPVEQQTLSALADDVFKVAFARGNAKPSLVNNRDFAFLGTLMNGNILGDDETPLLTLLCPAHSHFLRLQPLDENYDVVLELLQNTLDQLAVPKETAQQIMVFVESGRDGVMGRGKAIYENEDEPSRFHPHG